MLLHELGDQVQHQFVNKALELPLASHLIQVVWGLHKLPFEHLIAQIFLQIFTEND